MEQDCHLMGNRVRSKRRTIRARENFSETKCITEKNESQARGLCMCLCHQQQQQTTIEYLSESAVFTTTSLNSSHLYADSSRQAESLCFIDEEQSLRETSFKSVTLEQTSIPQLPGFPQPTPLLDNYTASPGPTVCHARSDNGKKCTTCVFLKPQVVQRLPGSQRKRNW